jgi:hypothetical protein
VEEKKREGRGAARGEAGRREAGAARGRSRTRREHLHPLRPLPPLRRAAVCALFFLADPAAPPLFTDASTLRPVATKVRAFASRLSWMPRPSRRGGTHRAPRRRAVAGEAGLRARLG